MLFKTYRNGQVRGYLLPSTPTPRSTPLSEKEIASRNLFAIAATVTKRRIEAGDTRRRSLIFKEVYASLKTQLQRDRNGGKCYLNHQIYEKEILFHGHCPPSRSPLALRFSFSEYAGYDLSRDPQN